jgi:hypothetical protein
MSPDLSVVHATKSGRNIAGSSGIGRQPLLAWAETSAAQGKYEIFGRNGDCLQRNERLLPAIGHRQRCLRPDKSIHSFVVAVLAGYVCMQNAVADGLGFSACNRIGA